MDSQLDQDMSELRQSPGVTGVLLADKNGLCVAATGDANPAHAGLLTQVASRTDDAQKALRLQESDRDILVTRTKGLVIAIYKKSSQQ